ncbi:MAG: hypothetical protein RBU21_06015 [FCB group bacterium]|jgi:hypothetical protein|nr:hypothetical protein [FCB group bacterium]
MSHLRSITHTTPAPAVLKGDSVVKECTPAKENAGKCEDIDIT